MVVRAGFNSLGEMDESEEDLLDRAWSLTPTSRLNWQAILSHQDVTIKIPQYSINHACEITEVNRCATSSFYKALGDG